MIASFTPFGYSGSSDSLSSAAASCTAVSSTVLSPVPSVAATAGKVFSCSGSTIAGFSMSEAEEVVVDGAIVGAVDTPVRAADLVWRNGGSFMVQSNTIQSYPAT